MSVDNVINFGKVVVSTGYDGAATSIVLISGEGTKLPTAPYNVTWWNSTDYSDPTDDPNREIVRVTTRSTDTLTVTRAQESTSATTHNTSGKTYRMIAGLTAKVLNTDIPATYTVSSRTITTTSPLTGGGDLTANRTFAINDSAADGTTKGVAAFAAADFNATSGTISIDYTNGQAADASHKGFLIAADWTAFNAVATSLTWGTVTFTNSWGTASSIYFTPACALDGLGQLHFCGAFFRTSFVNGEQVCTLPFSPTKIIAGPVVISDQTNGLYLIGEWAVATDGKLYLYSSTTPGHQVVFLMDGIVARIS